MHAVVFDFYGTLTPGTTVLERDVARTAVARALAADPAAFASAVRDSFDIRARGGAGDMSATMRWLAARCGIDPSDADIERACAVRLSSELAFMTPRAATLGVLAALRAGGISVGVLSDCTHELPIHWPALPYAPFVDAAVFSVETGRRKPDPAMYGEICTRLHAAPTDCLYVGDGGSNELTGARAAGLRAFQLRGPEFVGAHTYDAEIDWDGDAIHDLREILPIAGIVSAPAP